MRRIEMPGHYHVQDGETDRSCWNCKRGVRGPELTGGRRCLRFECRVEADGVCEYHWR